MNHSRTKRFAQFSMGLLLILSLMAVFASVLETSSSPTSAYAAPSQQVVPEIEFSSGSETLNENAGNYILTIQLNTPVTNAVQVDIETLQGTALDGVDYTTIAQQTLTVPTNTNEITHTITIVDDSDYEPGANEFFYVELSEPISATLGANWRLTISIVDDDPAPTSTPTPTSGAPPIFVDAYEPNNTLSESYTTAAGTKLCDITLWPTGDLDYFRFVGK
ncbi:MAG: hypothetical protein GY803_27850, partial [Chloroflexi bacterium]|nr:hypothetical protein [Chloroflexota bacterium]